MTRQDMIGLIGGDEYFVAYDKLDDNIVIKREAYSPGILINAKLIYDQAWIDELDTIITDGNEYLPKVMQKLGLDTEGLLMYYAFYAEFVGHFTHEGGYEITKDFLRSHAGHGVFMVVWTELEEHKTDNSLGTSQM